LTLGHADRDSTVAVAGTAAAASIQRRGKLVTTADWFDQLFGASPGEKGDRDSDGRGRRANRRGHGEAAEPNAGMAGHFRTMCVRLCDGFPIPMSFSTVRSRFAGDARRCAQACPGARLYVYPNPGGELADMFDLEGHPYRELPTAFLNQHTYAANCTCHGNPWDAEAVARHQAYAAAAARRQAEEATGKPAASAAERARRWAESHSETSQRR